MGLTPLLIMPIAFVCEFVDSTFGMGYGTTLTPILLMMGYDPLQIVPAILVSEFVTGITAATFHHNVQNVTFTRKSIDTKVALVLSLLSVIGVIAAVFVALSISKEMLRLWIGIIVISMGFVILVTYYLKPKFSWFKITFVGIVAAFNKGLSGGGYGPLVMGGQILSGTKVKSAIAITSLAEAMTCITGIIVYAIMKPDTDWSLAPWLMAGAILSVPLSAHTLKKMTEAKVKIIVAIIILALGAYTIWQVIAK